MSDKGFFRRWSHLKSQGAEHELEAAELAPLAQTSPHPPVAPRPVAPQPLPTLEDAARLEPPDSDFSAYVTKGVDKAVQRLAMQKLFSDPHFSVMDGLDVYIDDYNKSDPLSAAMLAALEHARSSLAPPPPDDKPPAAEPPPSPDEDA
jgi:hypothetical protein